MAVLPPATDAQVIAGTILGIAGMVINASMKDTLVLKTVSYLALDANLCRHFLGIHGPATGECAAGLSTAQ